MILQQHYLGCLAQASYLLIDEQTRTAAVIDPRRDVDLYVDECARHDAEIRHVFLTHFHADFLAGHLELRERCDATIHIGARAEAEFAFEKMRDGESLSFGDVHLEFLETPGHTPESVCILVYDFAADREHPKAVLTGDTLFIGDVGRPDLMASVGLTSEELAGWLYDSLRAKILPLPDETIVYPGHGAGSACGKNLSSETFSTLGSQRRTNYALQPMEREEFVRLLTLNQPAQPAYFGYDAQLNRSEHRPLPAVLEESVHALAPEDFLRRRDAGAVVLDSRDAQVFAAGHLEGSLNVGLDGKYASWTGTLVDPQVEILLIAASGNERESALRLGRIGFDRVAGYLEGGFEALGRGAVRSRSRLSPDGLRERLASSTPPTVIDVRTPTEWEDGHIEDALHFPLASLSASLERLPRDQALVLVCKSGYRSSTATSLLESAGFDELTDLEGGMDAWLGIESEAGSCSSG